MATVPKDTNLFQAHEDNKCNSNSPELKNKPIPRDSVAHQDAVALRCGVAGEEASTRKGHKGILG